MTFIFHVHKRMLIAHTRLEPEFLYFQIIIRICRHNVLTLAVVNRTVFVARQRAVNLLQQQRLAVAGIFARNELHSRIHIMVFIDGIHIVYLHGVLRNVRFVVLPLSIREKRHRYHIGIRCFCLCPPR